MKRALIAMAALLLTGCGAATPQTEKTVAVVTNCSSQQQASQNYYNLLVAQSDKFSQLSASEDALPSSQAVAAVKAIASAADQFANALPLIVHGQTVGYAVYPTVAVQRALAALSSDNVKLFWDLESISANFTLVAINATFTPAPVASMFESYESDLSTAESDALANSGACS
jgi:hypothetical protein